jgi:hypothetical protein
MRPKIPLPADWPHTPNYSAILAERTRDYWVASQAWNSPPDAPPEASKLTFADCSDLCGRVKREVPETLVGARATHMLDNLIMFCTKRNMKRGILTLPTPLQQTSKVYVL